MEYKATLNVHLLIVDSQDPILQVAFPLLSAHTNHSPKCLSDLYSHKPLLDVMQNVKLLPSHIKLNQIKVNRTGLTLN